MQALTSQQLESIPRKGVSRRRTNSHELIPSLTFVFRMRMEVRALPAMQAVMKQEKTSPCGIFSPLGLSAGVQRNTKVYMEDSKSACMTPRRAILRSACACV
jgi:hypothetical protein